MTRHDHFLHTAKWKGSSNFPLESLCAKHRHANEQLRAAVANGVHHQLPTGFPSVGYLFDVIEYDDPQLQAAMAQVRSDADDVAQTG